MWGAFIKAVLRREHKFSPLTWFNAIGATIYALWPADFIPDVIPFVGQIDDIGYWAVVVLLLRGEHRRFVASFAGGSKTISGTARRDAT